MTIIVFLQDSDFIYLTDQLNEKWVLSDHVPGNMVQVFAGMQMVSIGFHHHGNLVDKVHI